MLWTANKILLNIINLSTEIFIAFFIWEEHKDMYTLLIFTLALFIAAPVGALIASYLTSKNQAKYCILIGNWIQIVQITLILYFYKDLSINIIFLLGILGGLSDGIKSTVMDLVDKMSVKLEDLEKHYAKRVVMFNTLKAVIPLAIAYLVAQTGSYIYLFASVIALLLVSTILSLFLNINIEKKTFHMKEVFQIPGTNNNKLSLINTVIFEGLTEGITTTILPIMILTKVGNLVDWGYINTSAMVFTLIISLTMSKWFTDTSSRATYALGALIFATSSIFFISYYNAVVIVVFLLTMSFMDLIKKTSFMASVERIVSSDRSTCDMDAEYAFMTEVFTSIGRLVPIILILISGQNITDDFFTRAVFLITGMLPLITISLLAKTSVFDSNPGVIESIRKAEQISVPKPY